MSGFSHKKFGDLIDIIAEQNDELGSYIGFCQRNLIEIDLIFNHAVVRVDKNCVVQYIQPIQRIDEED